MDRYNELLSKKWELSELFVGSLYGAINEGDFSFASKGTIGDVVFSMYSVIAGSFGSYRLQCEFLDDVSNQTKELFLCSNAKEGFILAENYDGVLAINQPGKYDVFAYVYSAMVNAIAEKYNVTVDFVIEQLHYILSSEEKVRESGEG